jgi:ribosomal protein S18 acetylase RimI-like enzyme
MAKGSAGKDLASEAVPGRARRDGVRPATARDLDRVVALWTLITQHHSHLDPMFQMRPDAGDVLRDLLAAMLRDPDALILVYDDRGDLPGMLICRIDHAPPIMRETERAEITDLGVRKSERRRGIAGELVSAAMRWIRVANVERVEIQVARGNPEGQAFWKERGFANLMDVLHLRL